MTGISSPGSAPEGDAVRVTDPGIVARVAKAWADNGWPVEPDESGSGITAPFTHRLKDRRRGTYIASSHAWRLWCWAHSQVA